MEPIIGITTNLRDEQMISLHQDNVTSILQSGGVPFVLPNVLQTEKIEKMVEAIDGLLVTGGGDIDPTLFGEEPHPELREISPLRDRFEMEIIQACLDKDIPILALCRGCQMLNIAAGGDMYQDIYTQKTNQLLQHQQRAPRSHGSHYIEVNEGSKLAKIVESTRYKVNSFHHQAVRSMAEGFKVVGTASDGVIEAFESERHSFVIGVEWHPENMAIAEDVYSKRLFNAFVKAAQ
ncbi:putative glutamine amidotransferase [Geomicrobium halophilum]|uniref:Putative glutamine amidotransferase n=1 Tax=Geomicrobium halophilum TaxID=549000 RepID=A0A841PNK3_9BACL|nr:gamma-glutamyl-gamma-aminobutyrate hydrolase family protein [Geomicrobium halophilum]MBB6450417.1 putative glutamine amidotransferase [Geomicrobium halophilum]